jgi:acetyl-CoA carboxylase/biotin carboxylase 1
LNHKDFDLDRRVTVPWETSPSSDPRTLLCGEDKESTGLLDQESFREYLKEWAPGVVVGRGRLGGCPIGVIATECRTTIKRIPADPANPESRQVEYPQAGQVFFPDSAFKTASALRDFAGEQLPVLIIANWRGFSGGQRDLLQEMLKFGAMIVEQLAVYPLPVLVYIPPKGELRGGSWVPYCMFNSLYDTNLIRWSLIQRLILME